MAPWTGLASSNSKVRGRACPEAKKPPKRRERRRVRNIAWRKEHVHPRRQECPTTTGETTPFIFATRQREVPRGAQRASAGTHVRGEAPRPPAAQNRRSLATNGRNTNTDGAWKIAVQTCLLAAPCRALQTCLLARSRLGTCVLCPVGVSTSCKTIALCLRAHGRPSRPCVCRTAFASRGRALSRPIAPYRASRALSRHVAPYRALLWNCESAALPLRLRPRPIAPYRALSRPLAPCRALSRPIAPSSGTAKVQACPRGDDDSCSPY